MATVKSGNEERALQVGHIQQRKALNDAYAALVGRQQTQTFAAVTFEELLDAQIEQIKGAGTSSRPCLLDRVDRIESNLLMAIRGIKEVPAERMLEKDPERDVNT